MYPRLFEFGPISIFTYGALLATAYLVGLQFAVVRARTKGLDSNRVMDLGIIIILSALIGAKLLLVVVDFENFLKSPMSLIRAGGVFYGGLILSAVTAIWFIRRHKLPLWMTCDAFTPGIVLGQAIGRIGCFMAGCCYGKATELPWSIAFTSPLAAANVGTPLGIHLHPTQLYESATSLLILGILLLVERRSVSFPGQIFWMYLLLYPFARFFIEFYRGDPRGVIFNILSTSQFVSLLLIPTSIVMLIVLHRSWFKNKTRISTYK
jgi:phosphatidylglycerol:prolipoprotein diacylglycerol transferase